MTRSDKERFWTKVNFTHTCWLWTGRYHDKRKPYGIFEMDGLPKRAHRAGWYLTYGYWPNLDLLHTCDVMPCVRPSHLREGTNADNNADMVAKGRNDSKLTAEQVAQIRSAWAAGEKGIDIATRFGVTPANVSIIVNGKSWRRYLARC